MGQVLYLIVEFLMTYVEFSFQVRAFNNEYLTNDEIEHEEMMREE